MRKEQFSIGDLTVDVIRGGGLDPFTKRFYLDPVNGSDGNDGLAITRAKKSFAAGYALLTTNKNEVLYVLPGASANVITADIDWTKSYTNLIGLGGPNNQARGTRLSSLAYRGGCIISSTAEAVESVMHVTGDRNIFKGIIFNNGGANAACLNAVHLETGAGNYFKECTFQGINTTNQDIATASSLDIGANAHSPLFEDCIIGANTYTWTRTAVGGHLYFSNVTSAANPQNGIFRRCMFLSKSDTAGVPMVHSALGTRTLDRIWIFEDCIFDNFHTAGTDLTQVFLGEGSGGMMHHLYLRNCSAYGYAEWTQTDTEPDCMIRANMPITGLGGGLMRRPSGTYAA